MLNAITTALSGLNAASQKLNASASNIANVSTAGSTNPEGEQQAFQALTTAQTSQSAGGVQSSIIPKDPGTQSAFSPNSPFADENGLIEVPNVDLAEEAVNLNLAEIAYKASAAVIRTAEEMSDELLESFDKKA